MISASHVRHLATPATRRGATLVELLAAMAILSVFVLVLGQMLESSLARFREVSDTGGQRDGIRTAVEWMERDLASHLSSRPASLPLLPPTVSASQRQFFEGRLLLPFEVDRASGIGGTVGRSFANAAPEFSSLAFVARVSGERPEASAPSLVGYYVAYARHSPLAGESGAGMKLFRHVRRGGHPGAEGYADGIVRHVSLAVNDDRSDAADPPPALDAPNAAAVRLGRFENADLPFLLARRIAPAGGPPREAVQPWPTLPVQDRLVVPPPTFSPARGRTIDWEDPASPVHESVFPDEAVCDHVVRFELTPRRRVVLPDGNHRLMDAAELNQHLGLSGGDEWPVLVAPDVIDLVVATISEKEALRLRSYEDWIFDWDESALASLPPDRQRIARSARVRTFRLALPPRST